LSKRLSLLLFLLAWATSNSLGQQWFSQAAIGNNQDQQGTAIAVDKKSSFYATGYFYGCVGSGTSQICQPNSNYDVFIARYRKNGTLHWVKSIVGDNGFESGTAIATDDSGFVYVAGTLGNVGALNFGSFTLAGTVPNDVFVAKYDSNGNALWAKRFGVGTGVNSIGDLVVGGDKKIYACGIQSGNAMLMRLSPNGNIDWQQLYAGYSYNKLAWSTTALVATGCTQQSPLNSNAQIISVSIADGTQNWQRIGGAITNATEESGAGIAFDNQNNVTVAVNVADTGIFQSGSSGAIVAYNAVGGRDIALVRYDPLGVIKSIKLLGSVSTETAHALKLNYNGRFLHISGQFTDSLRFGSTLLTKSPTSTNAQFLAKMDTALNFVWANAVQIGGGITTSAIAIDTLNITHVTGGFQNSVTFAAALSTTGNFDAYVARFYDTPKIKLGTFAPTALCQGKNITQNFTFVGGFATGNQFILELSDSTGSFAGGGTVVATVTSTNANSITGLLPYSGPTGNNYRLRVRSTRPATVSDSVGGLSVRQTPNIVPAGPRIMNLCFGPPIVIPFYLIGGAPPYTVFWDSAGVQRIRVFNATGYYTFPITSQPLNVPVNYSIKSITDASGCARVPDSTWIVTVVAAPSILTVPAASYCQGTTIALTGSRAAQWIRKRKGTTTILSASSTTITVGTDSVGTDTILMFSSCADTVFLNVKKKITLSTLPASDVCRGGLIAIYSNESVLWDVYLNGVSFINNSGPSVGIAFRTQSAGVLKIVALGVNNACSDSIFRNITGFNVNVNFINNLGDSITVSGLGAPPGSSYYWEFGDSSFNPTGDTVGHRYKNAGTYTISLRAADSTGCFDTVQVPITISTTAVDPSLGSDNLIAYPNPAHERLTVRLPASLIGQTFNYSFTDVNGRTVLSGESQASSQMLELLAPAQGLYLLKLVGKTTTHRLRISCY
jgi:hypothetical protein